MNLGPLMQSALNPAGPEAARISHLFWLMVWVTGAVFVIVFAVAVVAVLRHRRERAPDQPLGHDETEAANGRMTPLVAAGTIITSLILFAFLIASTWTGRALASVGSNSAVSIRLTGHQWWWEAEYEDASPARHIITANEVHIPIGRPVVFKLTSQDVIHSLWIPNLQGKRDLIPGYTAVQWLQVDRPGVFRGQCAEFCGMQHAHMSLYVVAEDESSYQAWLSDQLKPADTPATEEQAKGRDVFLQATCTQCHTIRGTIAGARLGPDLTHVASRGSLAAGTIPNTRGHLAGWVTDPQGIKPGNLMPPNSLAADDLQALLTYLESLK